MNGWRGVAVVFGAACGVHAATAQSPTVTVSGVGYAQFGYAMKKDSSLTPVGNDNNFDVSRSYVNVVGKFSDGVMTRVTVDVDGRKANASQLSFRLKYAYVAWTPAKSTLTYKLGLIHTPWIDWEETLWDYRMQGPVALDRNGKLTSADFGAGIDGMWNKDQVNAQVGIYDGEGYGGAPGDQHKDIEGRLSVRLAGTDLSSKVGGLRLTGYAGLGKANGGGTRTRLVGMLSYKSKAATLAAEYAVTRDSTSATTPDTKGGILSAYGVFNLPRSKAAIIGRVDSYDPDTDNEGTSGYGGSLAANRQTRVIAGLSYAISPNLRVLADVDLNALQGGSPNNGFDGSRQMVFFHTEFKF
jgi:hypothetical protein